MAETAPQTVVERLLAAPKYRRIHVDTVVDVVRQETEHATSNADLERRARLKLHRITANYLATAPAARVLRGVDEALRAGPAELRDWCRAALAGHFSTAERLPDLDQFYPRVFALTGPATTVADLACALNPLTVPWLRDVTDARYLGYDLNTSYVDIGSAFLARAGLDGEVQHRDVLVQPSKLDADVALLLKTYHCIEDRRPGAALRLVEELAVPRVVVSFPVRGVGGRTARFTRPHIEALVSLARRHGWGLLQDRLATEELVVIVKSPS